jgi:hypothetical protein
VAEAAPVSHLGKNNPPNPNQAEGQFFIMRMKCCFSGQARTNRLKHSTTTPTKHQPTGSPASLRSLRLFGGQAKAIFTLLILLVGAFCADTARAQGALINGFTHQGTLPPGASNFWTFTAGAGDGIVDATGRSSPLTAGRLYPFLRIYTDRMAPCWIRCSSCQAAAEVSTRATNSGTFTVVAANAELSSPGGNTG